MLLTPWERPYTSLSSIPELLISYNVDEYVKGNKHSYVVLYQWPDAQHEWVIQSLFGSAEYDGLGLFDREYGQLAIVAANSLLISNGHEFIDEPTWQKIQLLK